MNKASKNKFDINTYYIFIRVWHYIFLNQFYFSPGGGSAPTIKSSWLQPKTQYLVIQLTSKLTQGRKYQLYTEFIGELADDLAGFYRSEYEEDGVRK